MFRSLSLSLSLHLLSPIELGSIEIQRSSIILRMRATSSPHRNIDRDDTKHTSIHTHTNMPSSSSTTAAAAAVAAAAAAAVVPVAKSNSIVNSNSNSNSNSQSSTRSNFHSNANSNFHSDSNLNANSNSNSNSSSNSTNRHNYDYDDIDTSVRLPLRIPTTVQEAAPEYFDTGKALRAWKTYVSNNYTDDAANCIFDLHTIFVNIHTGCGSFSTAYSYVSTIDSRYRDVYIQEAERGLLPAKRHIELETAFPIMPFMKDTNINTNWSTNVNTNVNTNTNTNMNTNKNTNMNTNKNMNKDQNKVKNTDRDKNKDHDQDKESRCNERVSSGVIGIGIGSGSGRGSSSIIGSSSNLAMRDASTNTDTDTDNGTDTDINTNINTNTNTNSFSIVENRPWPTTLEEATRQYEETGKEWGNWMRYVGSTYVYQEAFAMIDIHNICLNVHRGFAPSSKAESYIASVDPCYRDKCVREAQRGLIASTRHFDLRKAIPDVDIPSHRRTIERWKEQHRNKKRKSEVTGDYPHGVNTQQDEKVLTFIDHYYIGLTNRQNSLLSSSGCCDNRSIPPS